MRFTCARPRDLQFLLILMIVFTLQGKGQLIQATPFFITTRSRILISDCLHKGTCNFHITATVAKAKTFLRILVELRLDLILVGRRRLRHTTLADCLLFGEVILMTKAKGGRPGRHNGLTVIVLVTEDDAPLGEARPLGESVEHFGFRSVGGAAADLIAVGDRYRHNLLFSFLIMDNILEAGDI